VLGIALDVSTSWCLTSSIPFVERTQNELVKACGIVHCVTKGVLVGRQVACFEDIQYWHIELFHYFDLLVIKVLYPRVTAIGQSLDAAFIGFASLHIYFV
jgi:hypothetical protein